MMYKIFYNHETQSHTIINEDLVDEFTSDNDVEVYSGLKHKCVSYLEDANIDYQIVDTKCSIPVGAEGDE